MATTFQQRVKKLADHVGGPKSLADKAGLSRRTIGAYMSGETDPKRADLLKLATAGEVSLEWLAAGLGDMFGASATPLGRLKAHSTALADDLPRHELREPAAAYRAVDLRTLAAAIAAVEARMPQVTADAKAQLVVACYELLAAKGSADTTALKEFLDAIAGLAVEAGREHVDQERRRIRRRKIDAKDRGLSDDTQDEG